MVIVQALPMVILISCFVEFVTAYDMDAGQVHCPTEDSKWIEIKHVAWGIADRAALTVPREVMLAPSKIPGAGTGTFATTFIPRNTWLGEFEGEIILVGDDSTLEYAWDNHRDDELQYYIDGEDVTVSNWLRYMNCPRHFKEQNVKAVQCLGKCFYLTLKDTYPGEELLVYYGDDYARDNLHIDVDNYFNMDVDVKVYDKYACSNTTN